MQIESASTVPVNGQNSIAHVNKMLLDVTAKTMEEDDKKLAYDVNNLLDESEQNQPSNQSSMGINIVA